MFRDFYDLMNDFVNIDNSTKGNDRQYKKDKDGTYTITFKTPGVAPEDIHVKISGNLLSVYGETSYEGESYVCSPTVYLDSDLISSIKEIKYRSQNGITYVYIYTNPLDKDIKISKI